MSSKKVVTAGQALRGRREALQLTQRQASDRILRIAKMDVSPQELSRIENGQTLFPSMESLVAIGLAFDMTPNEVAQLYGYWMPSTDHAEDRELRPLMTKLRRIPNPETRKRLASAIETLLDAAMAARGEHQDYQED